MFTHTGIVVISASLVACLVTMIGILVINKYEEWGSEAGGIEAANQNHDLVMAPLQRVYFDHYQSGSKEDEPLAIGGMTPLDQVYAYEPVPEKMPEEKRHHILGSQGQLWTEYMPTMSQVEYMGFPRIRVLSEVIWLDPGKKDYQDFFKRLEIHRNRLIILGVNAHPEP